MGKGSIRWGLLAAWLGLSGCGGGKQVAPPPTDPTDSAPATGELWGYVRDTRAATVLDYRIDAKGPTDVTVSSERATGRFVFAKLRPGVYALAVRPGNSQYLDTTVDNVTVVVGKSVQQDLVVPDWVGELQGFVKLYDGTPVVGATVTCRPDQQGEPLTTQTGALGHYSLAGLPKGSYHLVADMAPDFHSDLTYVYVQPEHTVPQTDLTVITTGSVDALVERDYEVPGRCEVRIHGGQVDQTLSSSNVGWDPWDPRWADRHRFEHLPPGAYTIEVTQPPLLSDTATVTVAVGRRVEQQLHLRRDPTRPPGAITGTVRNSAGVPLPACPVTLLSKPEPREVTTDMLGHFELPGVPEGTYTIALGKVRPELYSHYPVVVSGWFVPAGQTLQADIVYAPAEEEYDDEDCRRR